MTSETPAPDSLRDAQQSPQVSTTNGVSAGDVDMSMNQPSTAQTQGPVTESSNATGAAPAMATATPTAPSTASLTAPSVTPTQTPPPPVVATSTPQPHVATPVARSSPHPTSSVPPSQPNPHGSPTRVYLNQNITPHLLEGMKHLAVAEPEKPLKWLSEFLAQKSRDVEGI